MGRPRKYGDQRMDTHLRIPVTDDQKALIDEATADASGGMAEWARAILLRAARARLARTKAKKGEQG